MNKPFKFAVIIGRFQTLHSGHEMIIEKALELADEVAIFIGSPQESGTYKNPFDYEIRSTFLRNIFQNSIKIYPLPDAGLGNNSL